MPSSAWSAAVRGGNSRMRASALLHELALGFLVIIDLGARRLAARWWRIPFPDWLVRRFQKDPRPAHNHP